MKIHTCACEFPATPVSKDCRQLRATPATSYISSGQAKSRVCTQSTGLFDQEFTISAKKGQHLDLSLINLSKLSKKNSPPTEELGYVLDAKTEKVTAIQTSHQSETSIVKTEGHTASIALSSNPQTTFIIAYKGEHFETLLRAAF